MSILARTRCEIGLQRSVLKLSRYRIDARADGLEERPVLFAHRVPVGTDVEQRLPQDPYCHAVLCVCVLVLRV
jgi:hypothetical protein